MIQRILNEEEANYCEGLGICNNQSKLNELILDEKQYDDSIDDNSKVKDYYKNMIQNRDYYLLAYKEDNEIRGYLFLKKMDKIFFIDALYVIKEYRRKGIATSLIKEAINIAGNNPIDINVLYANNEAYNLYKKLGFNDFKITMRKG